MAGLVVDVTLSLTCILFTAPGGGSGAEPYRTQLEAYEALRSHLLTAPASVHKTPPWVNKGGASSMTITLVPVDILSIDEIKQVMSVIVYVQFTWLLPDLAWNKTEYNDLELVEIDTGSVWSPAVNAAVGTGDSLKVDLPDTLEVTHDGAVTAMKQHEITFRCKIDFNRYPFDTQVCRLRFHVMTNRGMGMDIVMRTQRIDVRRLYDVGGEWTMTDFAVDESNASVIGAVKNPASAVFTLKRRPVYYVITIIFPLVLTSLMIPLVFLVPVHTGEKVSYLVAIFTSTAIFLNFICNVMPRGLFDVPYLAVLLIEVLVEGWLAMLASLVVVRKFSREEEAFKRTRRHAANVVDPSFKSNQAVAPPADKLTPLNKADQCYLATEISPGDKSVIFNVDSTLLDSVFFFSFSFLQILFLIVVFCVMDWL